MPGLSILDLLLIYDMKARRTDFSGTSTPWCPCALWIAHLNYPFEVFYAKSRWMWGIFGLALLARQAAASP